MQHWAILRFASSTRVVPHIIGKHVKAGNSFDITHADENVEIWDFTKSAMREKAHRYVNEKKPLFIIGSPPCDPFSTMQNLNHTKCDPIKQQQKMIAGRIHLAFCAELYQMQLNAVLVLPAWTPTDSIVVERKMHRRIHITTTKFYHSGSRAPMAWKYRTKVETSSFINQRSFSPIRR